MAANAQTPALPLSATAAQASSDHRQRLMDGLAVCLADRPLAVLTIADIVGAARVSKRTFYEQFASKEACFLALCEQMCEHTLAVIAANYRLDANWVEQLEGVTRAYLASLESQPALLKALSTELSTLGPEGMAVRRRLGDRFGL